ncbi:SRPBCC family protein [Sporichthya sp.]|uniref:SRPBCC family protein n=1 Tax=Sporichthya sp. TaxID=65475 RepID=UPI001811968E|nr:SRPBCC family protein [Sporichthya sp.]MBA3744854.1 SRPBCC family protein [Sporichthya sp.]
MRPIELSVDIDLPADRVWAGLVDWPSHAAWMPLTKVEVVGGGAGRGEGERIIGWTGFRPLAIADRMTITAWDPPRRLDVVKTGRMLKGTAWFEVQPLGADRSRVRWCEALVPPFGAPGRLLTPFLSIGTRVVIGLALRRFARYAVRAEAQG